MAEGPATKEKMVFYTTDDMEDVDYLDKTNQSEKIITMLSSGITTVSNYTSNKEDGDFPVYVKALSDYLISSEQNLSKTKEQQITSKITDLLNLMMLEKKVSFKNMSLDGRDLAVQLAEEIYELCGLEISYDFYGNIVRISDQADHMIYQKSSAYGKNQFHLSKFLFILLVIALLFGNCIVITINNQLFNKGVGYERFKKKGLAQ
jgi:hypothetical protein